MMKKITIVAFLLVLGRVSPAQEAPKLYQQLPIILTIEFQSFSMPFQDFGAHFKNIGIGIGTEVSLKNGTQNWAQSLTLVWNRNRIMGNGLGLYTQTIGRLFADSGAFGEMKIGVGYKYMFRPTTSYKRTNGQWAAVGTKGKSMLMIPINFGGGYIEYGQEFSSATFINYQFSLLSGYNVSLPVAPFTSYQGGVRIHKLEVNE